jgi:hypothetical protein
MCLAQITKSEQAEVPSAGGGGSVSAKPLTIPKHQTHIPRVKPRVLSGELWLTRTYGMQCTHVHVDEDSACCWGPLGGPSPEAAACLHGAVVPYSRARLLCVKHAG